jgi:hypothetical protein
MPEVEWIGLDTEEKGHYHARLYGVTASVDRIGKCWVASAQIVGWNGGSDGRRDDMRGRKVENAKRRALELARAVARDQEIQMIWTINAVNREIGK